MGIMGKHLCGESLQILTVFTAVHEILVNDDPADVEAF